MKVNTAPVVTEGFKTVVYKRDPRVTQLGRWLRCGLDELPQLWNIVRGEMAWVGPRPDEDWMEPKYGPVSKARLAVVPGITGFAQVLDSRHLPTAEGYAIDLWYIKHRTFRLNAWIVLVTPMFIAGWRSLGRGRLKRLRDLPEFNELVQCCDAELSAAVDIARESIVSSPANPHDAQP